jgi:hypothetical protein
MLPSDWYIAKELKLSRKYTLTVKPLLRSGPYFCAIKKNKESKTKEVQI